MNAIQLKKKKCMKSCLLISNNLGHLKKKRQLLKRLANTNEKNNENRVLRCLKLKLCCIELLFLNEF